MTRFLSSQESRLEEYVRSISGKEGEVQPFTMEHLFGPFAIFGLGIVASVVAFAVEVVGKRKKNGDKNKIARVAIA